MLSISKAVENILYSSDTAYFALQSGILNLSAYAKQIHKQVENECKKRLKSTNGIIMALSRLQKNTSCKRVILPKLLCSGVAIKHALTEVVLSKTPENIALAHKLISEGDRVVLITYGLSEINLVLQKTNQQGLKKLFKKQVPTNIIENLVSITLTTSNDHAFTPNVFYSILRRLATKEINLVEITTTQTEITLILEQAKLKEAYAILSVFFVSQESLY